MKICPPIIDIDDVDHTLQDTVRNCLLCFIISSSSVTHGYALKIQPSCYCVSALLLCGQLSINGKTQICRRTRA